MKNINKKIKNIFSKKNINKEIEINGWIKTKRNTKKGTSFIDIYDGLSINHIQITIKKNIIKKLKKKIKYLTSGCSLKIKGVLNYNKKYKKKEINTTNIKIFGKIKKPNKYPISPKYHTLKHLRNVSHLRPRTKIIKAISKIRNTLIQNLHTFFLKKNFYWIPTPIITSIDTEGYSKMFELKNKKLFFNKKPFLTVSGQLNLESYACSLSNVYNFGPVFRAEKSNTKKHLAEFWMLETEIAFGKLHNIINISKEMLSFCFKKILKYNYKEIKFLFPKNNKYNETCNNIKKIIKKEFIEINYKEIIKILKKKEKIFTNNIKWGIDISSEHEKYLTEKYFKLPLIIKNSPKKNKAFYMKTNEDKKTVSSMDIIFPTIGEIIGGSEREDNIKILDKNINKKKLIKKKYWWYRELRKYGTIPHAGFGLGFERLLMYITNTKNIRDVIPFPRYHNYLKF